MINCALTVLIHCVSVKTQLSEITIPHFVAAMIFSAQKGMTNDFYNNARLLVMMSCTYGLFRLISESVSIVLPIVMLSLVCHLKFLYFSMLY